MQLCEQQFVPFMQFHVQQGVPEHDAHIMWSSYEQGRMSEQPSLFGWVYRMSDACGDPAADGSVQPSARSGAEADKTKGKQAKAK